MQIWFIYALLSIITLAVSEISQKVSLTQKANISSITNNFFVWTLQSIGGLILAFIFKNWDIYLDIRNLITLLFVTIAYFLGGTFFYHSYKANSPSISIILGSISIVISTILGICFMNESKEIPKFIGIFLILFSIVYVNYSKKSQLDKYNFSAFLGGICYGIAYTLDKWIVKDYSPFTYLTILCFLVALFSLFSKSKLIITESRKLNLKNFIPIVISSIFFTFYNTFTFLSYKNGGNVGSVDAINNSSIFLIILFEIFIFKDKSNMKKKILGALIVTLGIALLSSTT